MKIVYLYPKSSLVTELRSDTLWGLIAYSLAVLYPDEKVKDFHGSYNSGTPPFLISSVFPFKQKDTQSVPVRFFPKPFLQGSDVKRNSQDKRESLLFLQRLKKFKKVKLLTEDVFKKFVTGEWDDKAFFESMCWQNSNTDKPHSHEELITHNTISRHTWTTLDVEQGSEEKTGQLFTTEETFFDQRSGLFFLAKGEQLQYLFSSLRYLEHIGFGGDISTGKGHFEVKIEDFSLPNPPNASRFLTLSLYSPTISEVNLFKAHKDRVFYETVLRKGHLGRNISADHLKKPVMMFQEGATFPIKPGQSFYGKNIVVRPPDRTLTHPVYHYGMAFDIKINA